MGSSVNFTPKITVLMPVYNCELYIKEAIDSILNQTFSDFEFLIIDDASTDKTLSIIKTYNDSRIQLIEKPVNSGYTNSLNYGLTIAKGKYIARMDGDDISLPDRFEKQVIFMEANQDVVVCGALYQLIGREEIYDLPEFHEAIKISLLYGNCLGHPTVMLRNSVLIKNGMKYNIKMEPAEDYDLWVRLIAIGKLHNLQEVLLNYRIHNTQVSTSRKAQQFESALKSRLQMLEYFKYSYNKKENDLLKKIIAGKSLITLDEIDFFLVLKEKMILKNNGVFFDSNDFKEYLSALQKQCYKNYFINRSFFYPLIYFQYFIRRRQFELKLIDEIKLLVKSLIFFKK